MTVKAFRLAELALLTVLLLQGTHSTVDGVIHAGSDALVRHQRRLQNKVDEHVSGLKDNEDLPLVWIDVAINNTLVGRIEMVLFVRKAPRAAENMRLLCSGELGTDKLGRPYHLKGSYFYRIIEGFIDQTGAAADGIFDGYFLDDPEGLKMKHTHKGLLSMAHIGPNTNGGHFSIMMGAARHLDGRHVIFGTIVSGMEVAQQVNALARGQPDGELLDSRLAQIVDAGQTRPGAVVRTPEFQAVIEAERRRVEWRRRQPPEELARLQKLSEDDSLPLMFLEVRIGGLPAGRITVVLFAEDAPLAAENFRLLCTGEAGAVPAGREGAGTPYSYKGATFYRIVKAFVDQAGIHTDSPLGGQFRDDLGGLRLEHDRMGLLSMANRGPNTNTAHFFILMGPAHHLDGRHAVFGEIVDGHDVAVALNDLAANQPSQELLGSKAAKIEECGQLRRGTYLDSTDFRMALEEERERLSKAAGAGAGAEAA